MATVISEIVWFTMAATFFQLKVTRLSMPEIFWRPVIAATAMGLFLFAAQPIFWMVRGGMAGGLYFFMLALLGEREILGRLPGKWGRQPAVPVKKAPEQPVAAER
jgi:hypothetical protein